MVAAQVVREGVRDPVRAHLGCGLEERLARLEEAREVARLRLELREVAEDRRVVRLEAQRVLVALDGLVVLLVRPLK